MESKIRSEKDFKEGLVAVPQDEGLAYLKLVHVAPSARVKMGDDHKTISEVVADVPGYYIISSNLKQLREAMHTYVDRMIDAIEKQS